MIDRGDYKQRRRKSYKKWRDKNLESERQRKSTWYAANKEHALDYDKQYRKYTPERRLLKSARNRANKLGIDFNIELSDIIIPDYCPYLNIKITNEIGKGLIDSNPSIDRIDNTKGYIKGNVQIISKKANLMKNNATIAELRTFAENIFKLH